VRKVRVIEDLTDDLIAHQTGEEVEAQRTHVLELDGRRVQLDLTEENSAVLVKALGPYLEAGYAPPRAAASVMPAARHIPGTTALGRAKTRNRAIKILAAERGIMITPGRSGKDYIPKAAKDAWDALSPAEQDERIAAVQATRRR
jgi:hypothetical protein